MEEKDEKIKAIKAFGEVAKRFFYWDIGKILINDNIIDYYVSKIADRSLNNNFLAIMGGNKTQCCPLDHLQIIKKTLFLAGILYVKENPEVLDMVYEMDFKTKVDKEIKDEVMNKENMKTG